MITGRIMLHVSSKKRRKHFIARTYILYENDTNQSFKWMMFMEFKIIFIFSGVYFGIFIYTK